MDDPHPASVALGDCILDCSRGLVLRDGELVPLRAKTFALLCHLAAHRGRVISKDELLQAIWPDVIVSEDSLTQCVRDLRKAIGDDEQRWVKTVPRRGYLLTAHPDHAPAETPKLRIQAAEPRVAVLPFAISDDLDPVLVDGITEEITNGLARFKTVIVIARASAFRFPVINRPSADEVGARLGADHLVEGTVRRLGDRYRITVSLTYAPTARQIWGEQFVCTGEELLGIDAVIARRIIGQLVTSIEDSVLRRLATKPPMSLQAFEHLLRGKMYLRGYEDEDNLNGLRCLTKAVELDPYFGLAHAYLALAEIIIADYGRAPRDVLEQARARASRAVALAPYESRCYRILGLCELYLRQHAAAESQMRRAIELNPFDADTLAQMGFVMTMRGLPEQGLDWLERAIALNPFRPAWYDSDLVFTLYSLGRYQEAAEAQSRIPDHGSFEEARRAAVQAKAGRRDLAAFHYRRAIDQAETKDVLEGFRRLSQFEHERDLQHLLDGIRLAEAAFREGPPEVAVDKSGASDICCGDPPTDAMGETIMTATRMLLLAALLIPAAAAWAQDPREAIRAACKADVSANCGTVFSRSKALACLVSNAGKLSSGCTSALKTASCNAKAPDNIKAAFPCTNG